MLYLAGASLLWSFSFGLIQAELKTLDVFLVSALRLGIAFLIFLPLLKLVPTKMALRLMTLGGLQFGAMYCLYISSYQYLSSHQIALLTLTTPLLVVFIDALGSKKAQMRFFISAFLAVSSAGITVYQSLPALPLLWGILLTQSANFCFALGQVIYRNWALSGKISKDQNFFGWMYLGAFFVPLILFLFKAPELSEIRIERSQWLSILYLGVFPSGLGFFLWNRGSSKVTPGFLATMNNFKVPLAALISWLVFQEEIAWLRFFPALGLMLLALKISFKGQVGPNRKMI